MKADQDSLNGQPDHQHRANCQRSGPAMDRIDIHVKLPRVEYE